MRPYEALGACVPVWVDERPSFSPPRAGLNARTAGVVTVVGVRQLMREGAESSVCRWSCPAWSMICLESW